MTEQERYELIIQELAEVIKTKNDALMIKDLQIEFLQEKLKSAEDTICNILKEEQTK